MVQGKKVRHKIYIVPIRTRLDAATGAALKAAAGNAQVASFVRQLIEIHLDRVGALSPIKRKGAAVQNPAEFVAAVIHLGSLAGNLQRLYSLARDEHRLNIRELLMAKTEIQEAATRVRRAIGDFEGA
jgi:hypothetical protein